MAANHLLRCGSNCSCTAQQMADSSTQLAAVNITSRPDRKQAGFDTQPGKLAGGMVTAGVVLESYYSLIGPGNQVCDRPAMTAGELQHRPGQLPFSSQSKLNGSGLCNAILAARRFRWRENRAGGTRVRNAQPIYIAAATAASMMSTPTISAASHRPNGCRTRRWEISAIISRRPQSHTNRELIAPPRPEKSWINFSKNSRPGPSICPHERESHSALVLAKWLLVHGISAAPGTSLSHPCGRSLLVSVRKSPIFEKCSCNGLAVTSNSREFPRHAGFQKHRLSRG